MNRGTAITEATASISKVGIPISVRQNIGLSLTAPLTPPRPTPAAKLATSLKRRPTMNTKSIRPGHAAPSSRRPIGFGRPKLADKPKDKQRPNNQQDQRP